MSLRTFIEGNVDAIIERWIDVAKSLSPLAPTARAALRDHWCDILLATAESMRDLASGSLGRDARHIPEALKTSAALHGSLRQRIGYTVLELVFEYRAMRTAVLSAWRHSGYAADDMLTVDELTQFNEALDQALASSIDSFSADLANARELFLAMLGHDLRDPLSGIEMATQALIRPTLDDARRLQTAARIKRAVHEMERLITDLLDYSRTRIGSGLNIARSPCDLGLILDDAVDAMAASFPQRQFSKQLSGDLSVCADPPRLNQMLSNLLYNAVQHGAKDALVAVRAQGDPDSILLEVTNMGVPIPADVMDRVFEPMVQGSRAGLSTPARSATSMGLGLYIVREIVLGHGGTIQVRSTELEGTVLSIRLPRGDLAGAKAGELKMVTSSEGQAL